MSGVILLNKPFRVLSQFTDRERPEAPRTTLAQFINAPDYRPAGRLDYDSEGLLVLTADGALQQRITSPSEKIWKRYWVQVEGNINSEACAQLSRGRPAEAAVRAVVRKQPPLDRVDQLRLLRRGQVGEKCELFRLMPLVFTERSMCLPPQACHRLPPFAAPWASDVHTE